MKECYFGAFLVWDVGRTAMSEHCRLLHSELHLLAAVPIYDSLGENAVEYIVKHAGVELLFIDVAKLPQFTKVHPSTWCQSTNN